MGGGPARRRTTFTSSPPWPAKTGPARVWNDFFRVRDACRDAERRFGLRVTAPADRTAARRPARSETEQAARRGWGEAPRVTLRREVSTAAAGARTEQEFFARLAQAGVMTRQRYSVASPGQVTGYAVGLAHHTARDGGIVWYGGGKLAADLTLAEAASPVGRDAARKQARSRDTGCLRQRPAPCSGARSPARRGRQGMRPGSSPGFARTACWYGCGSAT